MNIDFVGGWVDVCDTRKLNVMLVTLIMHVKTKINLEIGFTLFSFVSHQLATNLIPFSRRY